MKMNRYARIAIVTAVTVLGGWSTCGAWTWSPRASGTSSDLNGVAYGNGRAVAVGDSAITVSTNGGLSWTAASSPSGRPLLGIAFARGLFVAAGYADAVQGPNANVFTSSDGISWIPRNSQNPHVFYNVRFCGGLFIAVGGTTNNPYLGNGVVAISADGLTWQTSTNRLARGLYDVADRTGTYLAVSGDFCARSIDGGFIWENVASPSGYAVRAVDLIDGQFCAIRDANPATGERHLVYYSYAGTHWSSENAGTANPLSDIRTFGPISIIVGADGEGNQPNPGGLILVRRQRGLWEKETSNTTKYLRRVAETDRGFVAVGDVGAIVMADLSSPEARTTIATEAAVEAFLEPGKTYVFQTSSNLVDWADTGPPLRADPDHPYHKVHFRTKDKEFYRLRQVP